MAYTLTQFLRLAWLKRTDPRRYRLLRDDYRRMRHLKALRGFGERPVFSLGLAKGGTFKHSGHAGDIIYALPTVRALAGTFGARLELALDVPNHLPHLDHPLGSVMLSGWMYELLVPLLARQSYIREVKQHTGGTVDYDLDLFREASLPLDRIGISRWYFYVTGVAPDLAMPWLEALPDPRSEGRIVVARSQRYRNHLLDYRFLQGRHALFVGVEAEFRDLQQQVPDLEWVPVSDFLELASLIRGCRLFIGNQSFPYAVAEGLKAPRLLELDPLAPNVVPTGGVAHDVLFQRQFRYLVEALAG